MNSAVARHAVNYSVHPKPVPVKRTHTGDVPPKTERSGAKGAPVEKAHAKPPARMPRSTGDVRPQFEQSGTKTSAQHTARVHPPVKNKTGKKDMNLGAKANGDTQAPAVPNAVGGGRRVPSGLQDRPASVDDDERTDQTYDPKSGPMRRYDPPGTTGQQRKYKTLQLKSTEPVKPPKRASMSQRVKNMLRPDYTGPDKGIGISRNQ